ncbi:MAG: thymidine phosphorylase, partial [Candidatus Levybacteria bacterium]|nr:thymidine phosphorylase [Candidatus Levybacteria bacterium]
GKRGKIDSFDIKNLTVIARLLGSPKIKGAGIYLNKKIGEPMEKNDVICTFYSENMYNIKEAKDSLLNLPLFKLV